jgi:hypothetical protein
MNIEHLSGDAIGMLSSKLIPTDEDQTALIKYLETYLSEQNEQIKNLKKENQSIRNDYLSLYESYSRTQIDLLKRNQELELKQMMQTENINDFKELLKQMNTVKLKTKQNDEINRLKTEIEILKSEIVLLNKLLDQSKLENDHAKDELGHTLNQLNNLHLEFDCLKSSYLETCLNYFRLIDEKNKLLIQNKFLI